MDLSGKVALVTGAGRKTGLGAEIARQLAGAGATVWLTARDGEAARGVAEDIAGDINTAPLDITDSVAAHALAAMLAERHGRLDILINNAAAMSPWGETAAGADLAAARAIVDTTLFGTWTVTQAMLPILSASVAPRVVNVSSGAGSHGDRVFGLATDNQMGTSYAVAKAALNALTVKLAREATGPIRINAVCPGFTATFDGAEAMGARPPAESARGVLWAATLPDAGPTGGLFRDGEPLDW